mgnify:CR=1 FL=1
MSTDKADGTLKVLNDHLVLKKRHKRVLTLLSAESRFRVLERINGRPYDPDDPWQDEGGSG